MANHLDPRRSHTHPSSTQRVSHSRVPHYCPLNSCIRRNCIARQGTLMRLRVRFWNKALHQAFIPPKRFVIVSSWSRPQLPSRLGTLLTCVTKALPAFCGRMDIAYTPECSNSCVSSISSTRKAAWSRLIEIWPKRSSMYKANQLPSSEKEVQPRSTSNSNTFTPEHSL